MTATVTAPPAAAPATAELPEAVVLAHIAEGVLTGSKLDPRAAAGSIWTTRRTVDR